ncbi:MAG: FAD-binding protein [Candidatus Kapaibacterium sp.]
MSEITFNGATAVINPAGAWTNRHENVTQQFGTLYDIWNNPNFTDNRLADLQATIGLIQKLMATADAAKTQMRAFGGGWSLSTAAVTAGAMVNTKPMNWHFVLGAGSYDPGYQGNQASAVYVQCGMSVGEVNTYLAGKGLALKTSGASDGQTIVGAISTGTHGSRYGFGAMQDYVVGIHLIVSPTRTVWLERATYPVVNAGFASRFKADLIRDDVLFNAALVSFGSFGVIHGLMIETEPLYVLDATRRQIPMTPGLEKAMATLDFSGIALPQPKTPPFNEAPFHFEVVYNPHDVAGGPYVSVMYQRPYPANYQPVPPYAGGLGPGDDMLGVVGSITNLLPTNIIPGVIAPIMSLLVAQVYGPLANQIATPGDTFTPTNAKGKAMSTEIGVPLEYVLHARDILLNAHPEVDEYPGLISFRYIKGSKALLAFTQYPVTCAIELPAAHSDRTLAYYNRIWNDFTAAGIPFTLHWGQMNNFTPALVRKMYGGKVDAWIGARTTLLDPGMQAVFSNDFLKSCGLG